MIVAGISTDLYRYYNFDNKVITKNVYDPINDTYKLEQVQYFYNKIGELEPSKSVGVNLDRKV